MATTRDVQRKPTHPGAILREDVLPDLDVTQAELADQLGVSRLTVSELVRERRSLSADMALRLETLLGSSAEMWMKMQLAVDLWEARKRQRQPEKNLRNAIFGGTRALSSSGKLALRVPAFRGLQLPPSVVIQAQSCIEHARGTSSNVDHLVRISSRDVGKEETA